MWTLVKKMEVNNPVLLGLLDEEVGQCGTTWASSKLGGKPVSVLDLFFDKVVGNCRQFLSIFEGNWWIVGIFTALLFTVVGLDL